MFNNFLGGLSSGGGKGVGRDALPTGGNGVMFDEVEATADFANQLVPPPAEFITITQGDAPAVGIIPGVGGGGRVSRKRFTSTHLFEGLNQKGDVL
jgi:hypothetical protein